MKVIFATVHLEPSTRAIPLAAACLKAVITGHDVEMADYFLDQSAEAITESLLDMEPEIVGFPVYLWNRKLVIAVIEELRRRNPDLILIAGGPEVTAAPDRFLADSVADYAMQGEGEEVISPFIDALAAKEPVSGFPGIWTGREKPLRIAYCEDFNALASPILSGALDLSENTGLLWELSRGCPFACDFCFESKGSKKVRTLDLERIRQELEVIGNSGIQQVFVLDPTFNVSKKRVLQVLSLIKELAPQTYFYFEIRSEFLDDETAAAFSEIPCTLQIGLQSSNPETLKLVNRSLDPEAFRKKIALLSEYNISFGLDLIYGLPGDSFESYRTSLDYALSLEPNHLDLFPLSVLPGTVLYDNAVTLGLNFLQNDPYKILWNGSFSEEDIKRAESLSVLADQLYNSGKGISWFSAVCGDLNISRVDLVEKWGEFLQETDGDRLLSSGDIQIFLQNIYPEQDIYRSRRDLISYLEILDFLEEQEETTVTPEEGIYLTDASEVALAEGSLIRTFALNPVFIPQSVYMDGEDIRQLLEDEDSPWMFWTRDWEISFEKLDRDLFSVLPELKQPCKILELRKKFPDMENLEDLLTEGILEGYLQLF